MAKTYNIIRPATHQEWLEQRKLGIGSSEVGTILGVNPWETPYQLWRRKTGRNPQVEENDAMRWGHYLEDAIAHAFQDETGKQVIKASAGDWLAVDKQRDFLRVSPDRTYWIDSSRRADNKGILECKSTSLKIDQESVPQHWFCQLMYQLGVMGLPEGHLAWFITTNRTFGCMHIQFDSDFYAFMVDALDRFWNVNLVEGIEPDIVTIDDALLKYPKSDPGKVIEVTDELMADINQLKLLKPQLDELTKTKKALPARHTGIQPKGGRHMEIRQGFHQVRRRCLQGRQPRTVRQVLQDRSWQQEIHHKVTWASLRKHGLTGWQKTFATGFLMA